MSTLRPATASDLEACTGFLTQTTLLTAWYGNHTEALLRALFTQTENLYSFDKATLLEDDGKIVGMLMAYTHTQFEADAPTTRQRILQHLGLWDGLRYRVVSALYGVIGMRLGVIAPHEFYLRCVAGRTDEAAHRLLEHAIQTACQAGCKTLVVDVSADDDAAIKRYEDWGFQAVRRRWLIFRMTRLLEG